MIYLKMEKIKLIQKLKLKIAVHLFNTQETLSVTTNHIAKEAGISPGNLYYHYKNNKEEIVTDLYLDLSKRFEEINSFENILLSSNPIKVLDDTFELMGEIFYEYRFLLRDFMVLIALYPSFKENFVRNQEKE